MHRDMDDNELDITTLVEKYEQIRTKGRTIYFDADEFALLAEYYNAEGDNDEAEQLVMEGLKMHPGSPELMLLKVKTLVFSESYNEALEYMKLVPDDGGVELPLLTIEVYLHLGRFDDADSLINNTLERELQMDDLYYFITEVGYLLNDVDKFDRAISFLEQSMKIDESNADAIVDLAYAYEMKGNMVKAIEFNNLLLDIDPYSYDGWVNIGKLYSMDEQYDKAIDAFDFALTIKEDDLTTMKMKALSLYFNDNIDESIQLFRKCLDLSPTDESLYDSLIDAYASFEHYNEMWNIIKLKEERFGSKGIAVKRAYIYVSKRDVDTAKELFKLIPENERDTLEYYMIEGELAVQENDFIKAESSYIKASLISEDNEEILDKLANISVAREKYTQAAEYLEKLLELSPDFPTAKSRLAFIRFEIGSKEPFDEIMEQFTDEELRSLLILILSTEETELSKYSREKILTRLNEARENRVLFKNIKY